MTTEEWGELPIMVQSAVAQAGYSAHEISQIRFDLEAKPLPTIEVALRPKWMPKDIEFTVVVDREGD